jgi:hypothetical protein
MHYLCGEKGEKKKKGEKEKGKGKRKRKIWPIV